MTNKKRTRFQERDMVSIQQAKRTHRLVWKRKFIMIRNWKQGRSIWS